MMDSNQVFPPGQITRPEYAEAQRRQNQALRQMLDSLEVCSARPNKRPRLSLVVNNTTTNTP